jgi:hypothetical protein
MKFSYNSWMLSAANAVRLWNASVIYELEVQKFCRWASRIFKQNIQMLMLSN